MLINAHSNAMIAIVGMQILGEMSKLVLEKMYLS